MTGLVGLDSIDNQPHGPEDVLSTEAPGTQTYRSPSLGG
jgi:hypothetical protein